MMDEITRQLPDSMIKALFELGCPTTRVDWIRMIDWIGMRDNREPFIFVAKSSGMLVG